MRFNAAEIRFLQQENATRRLRALGDLRELGCPGHIFERILEDRASRLGSDFAKFKSEQSAAVVAPTQPGLAERIEAAKLF